MPAYAVKGSDQYHAIGATIRRGRSAGFSWNKRTAPGRGRDEPAEEGAVHICAIYERSAAAEARKPEGSLANDACAPGPDGTRCSAHVGSVLSR